MSSILKNINSELCNLFFVKEQNRIFNNKTSQLIQNVSKVVKKKFIGDMTFEKPML
jgi:hypothetical protein